VWRDQLLKKALRSHFATSKKRLFSKATYFIL
jgi:hypothetical protein